MTMSEAHARTTDVPEAERFDYFRDALSDVYLGIRTEWAGEGAFDASYDAYPVGGDVLAHMTAPGCVGRRGPALVKQRPDDAVYLNLSLSGSHDVSHLDRTWTLGRGMPILLDSEAPFVVDFADRARFRLLTLRLEKRDGFAPSRADVRRIDEQLARTPTGRTLAAQTRPGAPRSPPRWFPPCAPSSGCSPALRRSPRRGSTMRRPSPGSDSSTRDCAPRISGPCSA